MEVFIPFYGLYVIYLDAKTLYSRLSDFQALFGVLAQSCYLVALAFGISKVW